MFDWLSDEMAQVKTRKFHVVDRPMPSDIGKTIDCGAIPVPASYRAFILRFGNAKLFRKGSIYLVRIFAPPRRYVSKDGQELLEFGRTDSALAYFNKELLVLRGESPIFEWRRAQGVRKVANGFEEWVKRKCAAAKKRFSKKEWESIRAGPSPFSQRERAVVEARRRFRWRVVGIADNGDLIFEVHNGSEMILPYLSIGVKDLRGEPIGGVWLPVSSILPGQTRKIQKGCYKERHPPNEIEVFEQPDPAPEDRDLYWEFKVLDSNLGRKAEGPEQSFSNN